MVEPSTAALVAKFHGFINNTKKKGDRHNIKKSK